MSAADSRSVLIDSLRQNSEDFKLSNVILKKDKALKALQFLYRLREDLLNFAVDPKASPMLPPPPNEPMLEGLNESDAKTKWDRYRQEYQMWLIIKDAHKRKVPLDKYLMIEEYFTPYFKTIEATSAVKGKRFHAFTRTINDPKPKGLLGGLFGGGGDE